MKKSKKNNNFKIAMIGHKRIPSREGGVEIVVDELSTRYVKMGYQVDAYNRSGYHVSGKEFDEKKQKYYKGIRILTIPTFRNSKLNAIVYSVLATIRAIIGNYDVIHFHAEGPCIMLWLPKIFGIKVVATIHGLDWQRSKWGNFASTMLKFGEKIAAKYADELIVLSFNMEQYFSENYGRKTKYIPNGISKPILRDVNLINSKYELEKDGYILFLARIVPEKGLHYLVKAYQKIQTNLKLVIAGGSSHSLEYMDKIIQMTKNDNNIIMTGFVQGEILEELYSNAYCFVLPSDVEGMALSLLEAMSYGNCCIVSDIPENIEVVEDMALHFAKGSVKDLAYILEKVLDDKEYVNYYKERSQEFILNKYDWNIVAEKTLELYKEN